MIGFRTLKSLYFLPCTLYFILYTFYFLLFTLYFVHNTKKTAILIGQLLVCIIAYTTPLHLLLRTVHPVVHQQ